MRGRSRLGAVDRPTRGVSVPSPQVGDVLERHRSRLHGVIGERSDW
jgi:hypothetical protein